MAALDQALILGGHTAKILIDNKDVGFFFDLSLTSDYGLQDAPVLGQTTVVEHQQTRFIVSWEARRYYIRDEVVHVKDSLMPISAAEAIRKKTFDLAIVDKVSGKVVRTLHDNTLGSGSTAFSVGQLVSQRITGRAIDTDSGGSDEG